MPEISKITLRYPVEFEQKIVEVVELDFDKLNGRALQTAEKRFIIAGNTPGYGALSDTYCAFCAAEISGLPWEFFYTLKAPDYNEVVLMVRHFLLGVESPEEELIRTPEDTPTKSEDSA